MKNHFKITLTGKDKAIITKLFDEARTTGRTVDWEKLEVVDHFTFSMTPHQRDLHIKKQLDNQWFRDNSDRSPSDYWDTKEN